MTELAAASPFEGLNLPLAEGGTVLAALPDQPRFAIAAAGDAAASISAALGGLPDPGELSDWGRARIFWAGVGLWLVEGEGAPALARTAADAGAAVTDQSDAWAGLALTGPWTTDTLARLASIDTDPAVWPPGSTARSLLRHTPCLFVAISGGVELRVARSYARTVVGDLAEVLAALAGRSALPA